MQSWLNYHHLLYFWTVAREGGLAPAAAKLNVTQPTISAQIRELEDSLGERLFRRVGRRLQPTDAGEVVLGYADEIFSLGNELLLTIRQRATRSLRVHLGVADSVPKLLVRRMVRPIFTKLDQVRVICREGSLAELIDQLANHKLDIVLAEEPSVSAFKLKGYSQKVLTSGISILAEATMGKKLRKGFPHSLDGQPAVLPSEELPLRRQVERWFEAEGIRPRVVAEVEDTALMKDFAAEGFGFIALHEVIAQEACREMNLMQLGRAEECKIDLYAIMTERRIHNSAVVEMLKQEG